MGTKKISREAKRLCKVNNITTRSTHKLSHAGNCSQKRFLDVYRGYDFLQYQGIYRMYITRKHDIHTRRLELLLMLFPYKIFTSIDYHLLPRSFDANRIDPLIRQGFIEVYHPGRVKKERLYVLTTMAQNIVIEYYDLLAGVRKMDNDFLENLMDDGETNVAERKRLDLLKKISGMPMKEHNKLLYKDWEVAGTKRNVKPLSKKLGRPKKVVTDEPEIRKRGRPRKNPL